MAESKPTKSPPWGTNLKLVISIAVLVILGAVIVRFRELIVPILFAFIVAYLLLPLASLMSRKTPLNWSWAVNIIYLVFILILLGLLTWGGVGLVGQIQNLITAVQKYANDLPGIIDSLSNKVYMIGPFRLDFTSIDWLTIGQNIMGYVEPALGKLGGLVGTLATRAAAILGWLAFVIVVSYFFLLESGGLRNRIIEINIPDYSDDMHRLTRKLAIIWSAYLRGQIIIFFSKVLVYMAVMSLLGVHYAIPVALIAGLASFLPYIGPAINMIVLGLVTFFQGGNMFGLAPLWYMVLAIGVALLIDQAFDNLVAPRIMAQTLKVHPAFVLIAAIIAANLLGLVGIVLAAPLLATLQLIGKYTMRKLLDQDPWPPGEDVPSARRQWKWFLKLRSWWRKRRGKDIHPAIRRTPEPKDMGK